MWINGEWREIMLMNYEFYTDPPVVHSGKVKKLLSQAIPLIKTGDPESAEKAEQLLKKAIAITPTAPDLQNNLASAYQMQGRFEEAEALIQEIADRYPDYMFARVAIALQHIDNGNIEAAEALLKPFLTRRKFHILEFAAFSNAYIELLLAQKNHDAAQGWLSIWENVDPDHPLIKDWKQRLKSAKRSSKK
jgi:tetratricopeptide (TPR) repeat protein